jgi:hypothetical protein
MLPGLQDTVEGKPDAGLELDPDHPFAPDIGCWLFTEGQGALVKNLVDDSNGSLLSDYTWGSGANGPSVTMGTSTAGPRSDLGTYAFGSAPFTVVLGITPLRADGSGLDITGAGKWNTGVSFGTNEWILELNYTVNPNDFYPSFGVDTGSVAYAADTNPWTVGSPLFLAGTRNRTSLKLYRGEGSNYKGLTATGTCGAGALSSTSQHIRLGDFPGSYARNTTARYHFLMLFGRELSGEELGQIWANPYQVLLSPAIDRFFSLAGALAGQVDLTGAGSLSAAAIQILAAASALTGVGSFSASAVEVWQAAASQTGVGILTPAGVVVSQATAALLGVGSLSATGSGIEALSSLIGVAVLNAQGVAIQVAQAAPAGIGSLSASGINGALTPLLIVSVVGSGDPIVVSGAGDVVILGGVA